MEGMGAEGRRLDAIGAGVAFALVLAVQVMAIHAHSVTGDGAHHLLAGQRALTTGTNTLNLEHPPLVKLVVAAPSLALGALLEPSPERPRDVLAAVDAVHADPARLTRAVVSARYAMLACFVLPLLAALHFLGRRVAGARGGVLLVLLTGLSFSTAANLTVLQTDTAATLATVCVALAGLRLVDRPGLPGALLLGAAAGLGVAVKHSGLLLGGTAAVALVAAFAKREGSGGLPRMGLAALCVGGAAFAVLEGSYALANPRYDPALGRAAIVEYTRGGAMLTEDLLHDVEDDLLALEEIDPRLAQWATGVLGVRAQNSIGVYPSYAFGRVSFQGRWWYFPALLAVKLPLVILVLGVVAVGATARAPGARGPEDRRRLAVLVAPVVVHLGMAIPSNYNLGFRHLLPIVPFLLLPVVAWLVERPRTARLAVGLLALECLALTPRWMSATNTWWLGERNPTLIAFGAGNLEYGQGLIGLGRFAERHAEGAPLRVLFPRMGAQRLTAHVPGAVLLGPDDPTPPGLYAVNLKVEQLLPAGLAQPELESLHALARRWQPIYERIQAGEDLGIVAGTFRIRRLGSRRPALSSPRIVNSTRRLAARGPVARDRAEHLAGALPAW